MATQGKYAVIDTTLTKTDATVVPALSGRQGDNGRVVYFALKDGNLPHNLDGQDVQLSVKDAAGKVKVLTGIYDMISATAGIFSMLIPAEFYQSAGDVEEAYLSVVDNQNTTISSIPITFTVFANGIIISANASQDYINTVQKMVDKANELINGLNNNINAQQTAYDTLKKSVESLTSQINDNKVALLNTANHFTDSATFDGGITTPKFKADNLEIQQTHDGETWHNLADDDAVVHTLGNEAIPGNKTYTGSNNHTGSETFNGEVKINGTDMSDTGWKSLTLSSGMTASLAKYRIYNGVCFLRILRVAGAKTGDPITVLPPEARPDISGMNLYFPWISGEHWGNLSLNVEGVIGISSGNPEDLDTTVSLLTSYPVKKGK